MPAAAGVVPAVPSTLPAEVESRSVTDEVRDSGAGDESEDDVKPPLELLESQVDELLETIPEPNMVREPVTFPSAIMPSTVDSNETLHHVEAFIKE